MSKIEIRDLTKSYDGKTNILEKISLDVEEGEFYVLVGPSGCGKSTLLRIIAGLEKITDGTLKIDGKVANNMPPKDRNLSMVFQNYALYPHMTVKDNILFGLDVKKVPKSEQKRRLDEAAEMLGLTQYLKRKPRELSGGQRQRVALARALVKQSRYLLLDEPLSNLDAQLRVQARKELVKIHELYKQTFVYVTHDQVEAMTVGQRVALMNQGQLQMVDTPYRVYNRPANIFTAKFIGSPSTNILDADWSDGALRILGQRITLPDCWNRVAAQSGETQLCLGIRPEHVHLQAGAAENAILGTLRYVEDYGNKRGAYVSVGDTEIVCICDRLPCAPGGVVSFALDSEHIHLFSRETTQSLGYPPELDDAGTAGDSAEVCCSIPA